MISQSGQPKGAAAEALDQIVQDHLFADAGHEFGVIQDLGQGLGVAFAGFQAEAQVIDVAGLEHGLDLRLGVGGEALEIAELGEAVAHQVVEGIGGGAGGGGALGLDGLAGGVVGGLVAQGLQLVDQALAALAVLVLALMEDLEGGMAGGAVVFAQHVFLGLQVGAHLALQALVVGEAQDELAAVAGTLEDTAPLPVVAVVVGEGGDDQQHQVALGAGAVGVEVAEAGEAEVLAVVAEAVFAQALEDVLENQLAQELGLLGGAEIHLLDFLADVALLVGEEGEVVAVAADEGLALQALQAGLQGAALGQAVGVDAVDEEGHQVVQGALDLVHVADEEEGFEDQDVDGLQLGVAGGLVDGGFDDAFEEALDGGVKAVEGHQDADGFALKLDGGGLEGVEHGALAAGQVQAGDAVAADGLEDLLHQLELVRGEGVNGGKVGGAGVGFEGHADIAKAELVFEDVGLGVVEGLQCLAGGLGLAQEALLDDLVHIGAGQGEAGLEAALDLGEVVGAAGAHFAEDGVDVLLGGNDHPGPAAAEGAEIFGDGLEVEHQVGVLTDELTDLVHQEDQAMAGTPAVEVVAHPAGEVFHREQGFEVLLGLVEPGPDARGALAQGRGEGAGHLVGVEAIAVPLLLPVGAGAGAEGGLEGIKAPHDVQAPFQIGDVGVVAAVAEFLVEDLEEDPQDGVAAAGVVGLAVDVEKDDVHVPRHGALDVRREHGVLDLAVEKREGGLGLAMAADVPVAQQVVEDLQKMGLAGAEESRNPDANRAAEGRITQAVEGGQVGGEKAPEVNIKLLGDDIFLQLLPDGFAVVLVRLDDAIDGAVDGFYKEVLDLHGALLVH